MSKIPSSLEIARRHPAVIKLLVLLGITLLAAFFRLYRLDTLPPAEGYDPAYYGVDALQILAGERPVFLPSNFGREALFSYLVALCVALFGISSFSVHVASALVGILTVPAVYLVAEELLAEEEGVLGRFGGLLAALAVSISYWHFSWSRYGVRAILVPLFAAITFFCLWRAFGTNSKRHFVAAGFFLGLGMYSYQVARFLPFLVVLGFVYVTVSRRDLSRHDFVNLAIVTVVALVVFAPLGYYFVTHPGSFSERIRQVSVFAASRDVKVGLQALGNELLDVLSVFIVHGDDEVVHNLPGRPALDGFLAALFFVGVFVSLLRIKKPAFLFVLTWLVVMSVPTILSQFGPATKRAIGTMPAVMVLIAIGALAPWQWLSSRAARHGRRWVKTISAALAMVIVAGFMHSAVSAYHDYFVEWADRRRLFTDFQVGLSAIGQYVGTLQPEEDVFVSPVVPDHPSVIYNSGRRAGVKGYNGQFCLVMRERVERNTTYIIVPAEDRNSLRLLRSYYTHGEIVADGPLHYFHPFFSAFRVLQGARAPIAPSHLVPANWANKIGFLGYDLDADSYEPGDVIRLTLYYQALQEMGTNYTVFTHLMGPNNPATDGSLWGQDDSEPCRRFYPTSVWAPGEIVRDQYSIMISVDAPAGAFDLRMGFYTWPTMEHLLVMDETGVTGSETLVLGQVTVTPLE
jgi:4-amino-4-deoxy-L-arabinose transferase-like glycosyltransferase